MDEFNSVTFFSGSGVSETVVYWTLGSIAVFSAALTYGSYCYQKWRRYNRFVTELKTLDLEPDQEGTFADIVKRYHMAEPVNILYSKRLYDEMAASEMVRVLSSPGTVSAKAAYIDSLYEIRDRTYANDWDARETGSGGS